MREAVIVSAVRLPVGRVGGALKDIRPEKLGGMVIKEALKRGKVDPNIVDECIFCSCDNEDIKISGRVIALEGGLPVNVPGYQIQRGCGSSLTAVWDAAMMVQTGFADTIVCGGVESTTFAPYLMNKPTRAYSQAPMKWCKPIFSPEEYGNLPNGPTADNIAKRFGLTREDCDAFAVDSHRKGALAYQNHRFDEQILPVEVQLKGGKTMTFDRDEPLRDDCSMESLAKLRPSFAPDGVCTAGNSSPLVDGASCVIVMEREKAESLGLDIMVKVTNFADAGCEPAIMGEGPVHACRKLFKKTGLTWDDIDLIEMNEAFAAQSVHCIRELNMPVEKLNVNGGAIALGHPFAATGTILVTKIVYEMRRTDAKRGVVTFCIGGGQGVALLLEKP